MRVSDLDMRASYPLRTVCEVTREIYDILWENKSSISEELYNEIYEKLVEQMQMQKKMDKRLRYYKAAWLLDEKMAIVPDFEERERKRGER